MQCCRGFELFSRWVPLLDRCSSEGTAKPGSFFGESRSLDQNCVNASFFANSVRVFAIELPTEFINKMRWGQRFLGPCPEA